MGNVKSSGLLTRELEMREEDAQDSENLMCLKTIVKTRPQKGFETYKLEFVHFFWDAELLGRTEEK